MEIDQFNAEDLINGEEELAFYRKGMEFFHLQLVRLNVNIFILNHVLAFPFHLFADPHSSLFFRMVFENFFNASLLVITKVAADPGGNVFTLQRFKNRIRRSIRPEFAHQFDERLRRVRFDANTHTLLDRTRTLRNTQVAHISEDIVFGRSEASRVVFGDLESLRDQLNSLLDAISFNVEHLMLPIPYHPNVQHPYGYDNRPDIEVILDSMAERSSLLNLPERDPLGWHHHRKILSQRDIELINKYRRKFNLVEV